MQHWRCLKLSYLYGNRSQHKQLIAKCREHLQALSPLQALYLFICAATNLTLVNPKRLLKEQHALSRRFVAFAPTGQHLASSGPDVSPELGACRGAWPRPKATPVLQTCRAQQLSRD